MFTRLHYFTRWSVLASCSLIFAVLLVACGGSGTGGTTSTPGSDTYIPTSVANCGN